MAKKNQDPRAAEIAEQIAAIGETDTFGTKKEIRYLPEVLATDERLLGLTSGMLNGNTWLIVCTDRRVVFLDKGMLYGLKQTEIPLDSISSISHETGMMYGSISVTGAGLAGMKIKQISKKSVAKFARTVQEARQAHLGHIRSVV